MAFTVLNNGFSGDISAEMITGVDTNIIGISGGEFTFLDKAGILSAGCSAQGGLVISVVLKGTKIAAIECISSDGNGGCKLKGGQRCVSKIKTQPPAEKK